MAEESKDTALLRERLRQYLRQQIHERLNDRVTEEYVAELEALIDRELEHRVSRVQREIEREINAEITRKIGELRRLERERRKIKEREESFVRFSWNVRIQHLVLFISVIILIITGLPLKFHEATWAEWIMGLLGGIRVSRLLHRIAATGLIGVGIYHLFYLAFSKEGRYNFRELLPRPKDFTDFLHMVQYFLGLRNDRPRFGRFSYVEKFDYWAVYWGMVIMIGSGLLLWFEEISLRIFPKFVIDIAKEAHSDEALLATLAIIIWHFYNAHLNPSKFPMNMTMFTGRISKYEMMEEHPLEYEQLVGKSDGETTKKGVDDHA